MIRVVLFIIISTTIPYCIGDAKTWIVNTNVTIGSRFWDALVTIGNRNFNGSMTTPLAITSERGDSEESCEIIYPLDPRISLNDDFSNQTDEGECADEELLTKMDRVFWIDPRNWKSLFADEATPDVERIPCDYDSIIIPNTTSTFIILPPNPVKLRYLKFGNTTISGSPYSKKQIFSDEYFQRHFILKSGLNLTDMFNFTQYRCTEKTGCECGTLKYEEEICDFIKDNCTKDVSSCSTPVKATGYCCPMCAGIVIISFNKENFVYSKFAAVVEKFIKEQSQRLNLKGIIHISRVYNNQVQIVIIPKDEYSIELADMTQGLSEYLEKTTNLGIEYCFSEDSGEAIGSSAGWLSTKVKITIGLCVVLFGGIILVYAIKLKLIEDVIIPYFKNFNDKQHKDENIKNQFSKAKETQNEDDTTENEEVPQIEPTTENEQIITNLIDTSE